MHAFRIDARFRSARHQMRREALPVLSALPVLAVLTVLAAAFGAGRAATAGVTVPAVLGDHMVLQRETNAPLWGWARPGEAVAVEASWGRAAETVADRRGRWRVDLPTPEAGGPHTIVIAGETSITLSDVMVGEVWVCSGQSNMEWPMSRVDDAEAEIASARFPDIRLFMVENTRSAMPRIDCRGAWAACSPDAVRNFSATGYFFGRDLHEFLDVPIGLIAADWGGTVAQAWTSAEALGDFPEFADELAFLQEMQDPAKRTGIVRERVETWWRGLDGDAAAWITPDFDDESWKAMELPAEFAAGDLGNFDGVAMFRRTVDVPRSWMGARVVLELGPIDDYDDVWINGTHVGATHEAGRWATPRAYSLPECALAAGRNLVAVRVLDTGGLGGMNGAAGQMQLRNEATGASISLAGPWKYAAGKSVDQLPTRPNSAGIGPNMPTVLYNGMIAPLVPYAIRGAVWYQGESNRRGAVLYRTLFPAMIESWRDAWGRGDFPFYYVQIAPFAYGGDTGEAAQLREAQMLALAVPNTGMAVTMDIGNPRDIHPTNKRDVGRRLALWALAGTYGESAIVHSGPVYRSMRIDGATVRLSFDHLGTGPELRDGGAANFLIAGADRRFVAARAVVDGDEIVVSAPGVRTPVAVRYAWDAAAAGTLFNREGLPASSFRTDAWE